MSEWADEILPVLEASYRAAQRSPMVPQVEPSAVNEELGRENGDPRTERALHQLAQTGYLKVILDTDQSLAPRLSELTEKALIIVGGWPGEGGDALYARFMQALDEAVASTSEIGKGVLVSVLSNLARIHGVPI